MTVKELASQINELFRQGRGDHTVLIAIDKGIMHPILDIRVDFIDSLKMNIVVLDCYKKTTTLVMDCEDKKG